LPASVPEIEVAVGECAVDLFNEIGLDEIDWALDVEVGGLGLPAAC
jgi:hypothetical protein